MNKNFLIVFILLIVLPYKIFADWVPIDHSKASNTPPEVRLISDDNNSTVIKIDLAGFDLNEFVADGKTFQSVDLLTDIFATEAGSPELPSIAKILAIPHQAGISFEIVEVGEVQVFKNINIPPARLSWLEGQMESLYSENEKAYKSNDVYPQEYVKIDPPSVFRDFRIARVSVFPIRYVPAKKELQAVSSITILINYGEGEVVNPKISTKKGIAPSFAKLYRSFIFNYESVLDKLYDGKENDREVMLCVMPDEFYSSFQIYADWKRKSGTDIHITKFSDIGANAYDPDIIKDHIADAYFNWEYPPTHVLLVGDDGTIPVEIVNFGWTFPNEDYFVEVEGNDFFPEMMIGRFTNQGDYGLQVMLNKFLLYEQNPYTADTSWFEKGICCSNNAYESQIETKRFAAERMIDYGFSSVDTMMSSSPCNYDLNDVLNAINEGRSYLNYRGEGWSSGWWASCTPLNVSYLDNVNNGQKFPFVTSIGCGVAMFNNGNNCFGEEWLEMGTLSSPKGAAAFIGPTSNTHTTYNNKLDKGIYVGMFQEGMDSPGQALLRGKLYVYNVFGNDPNVEYQYKVYCLLGDPSMHIWKDIPLDINADYETSVLVGNNLLEFTVTFTSTGLPVENAQVCLAGNEIYETAFTDSIGNVIIEIAPEFEDTLSVVVRGGNVVPYVGTIEILNPQELVEPEADPVIVDLDGNLDGLINPNENCNITFTLKNWGSLTASNVQATLLVADTNYAQVVTTNPISFGNITSGSSFTGEPFQFFVKPICEVGQIIPLQLHVSSTTTTWDYNYNVDVLGCVLEYNNLIVCDEGSANVDYRLDPGETGQLVLSIGNVGVDVAPNVKGVLSCNDPYITIEDDDGSFGTVEINGTSTNINNYFVVTVDASCPTEYFAECSVTLSTEEGNYPYQIIKSFNLPVAKKLPSDYTGPDSYGYFAYSSEDVFYEKTPTYDWFEIKNLGVQINVPSVSDYTETVNLPFTFKYYGIDYSHLRISTDGWIAPNGGQQIAPNNIAFPNNDNVDNMVAVFWDDLYDVNYPEGGGIFYYSDVENHRFIIQWDSITHNGFVGEPNKEVFQAILLDPEYYPTSTGDGEIIVQYKNVEEIQSMTIGIENNSQDIALQYVYNEDYDPTSSNLTNGLAIMYSTEAPCIPVFVSVDENKNATGRKLDLEQNYPNPFISHTWINYTLSEVSDVKLHIYNIEGDLVRILKNEQQAKGKYSIEWNGLNDYKNHVKPGIYFYRIEAQGNVETKKMLMLK